MPSVPGAFSAWDWGNQNKNTCTCLFSTMIIFSPLSARSLAFLERCWLWCSSLWWFFGGIGLPFRPGTGFRRFWLRAWLPSLPSRPFWIWVWLRIYSHLPEYPCPFSPTEERRWRWIWGRWVLFWVFHDIVMIERYRRSSYECDFYLWRYRRSY